MKNAKTIPNKTVDLRFGNEIKKTKYSELAKQCLETTTVQGIPISEIRQRLRILDSLEAANVSIDLDPSDLSLFKKVIMENKWVVVSHGIVEFVNDVEALK
ncbi:MAG: hypothetical protein V4721_16545 [Bacteroidota bacterium]